MKFLIVAFVPLMIACGGTLAAKATGAHRVLNVMADVVNPSYALAVQVCDARELLIVEREGTTLEQDREAIARIRSACDDVFKEFEHIRDVHELARVAIEEAENGEPWEDVEHSLTVLSTAWAELTLKLKASGLWPTE